MAKQTVYDLARQDQTYGVPTGEKANFITEMANQNMNMTVTEFSERVIGTQVSESYIRQVLKEQNPAAFGITVDETIF